MESFEKVTLIFAMPRSRSQWMRWFLASGFHDDHSDRPIAAWHDPLSNCSDPQRLVKHITHWLNVHENNSEARLAVVDTGAIFFWEQLTTAMPGVKEIFMFRNPADIIQSLHAQLGLDMTELVRGQHTRMMNRAYGRNKIRLHYEAMTPVMLMRVFNEVTGRAIDIETVIEMSKVKIDVPMLRQPRNNRATAELLKHVEKIQ